MEVLANPNYKTASTLVRIAALLGLISYIIQSVSNGGITSYFEASIVFFALAFLIILSLLIRKEYRWIKWLFLGLMVVGLVADAIGGFQAETMAFKANIFMGIISILQNVLELIVTVLLFMPNKNPAPDLNPGDFTNTNNPI